MLLSQRLSSRLAFPRSVTPRNARAIESPVDRREYPDCVSRVLSGIRANQHNHDTGERNLSGGLKNRKHSDRLGELTERAAIGGDMLAVAGSRDTANAMISRGGPQHILRRNSPLA